MWIPPKKLLEAHGLRAKKAWGQNFLHDQQVVQRIIDVSGVGPSDVVVEIGAGLGALTMLLCERVAKVVAIERDRDLAAVLRDVLGAEEKVVVVEGNALTYDFATAGERVHVIGNLPYHISSPLLFRVLEQRGVVQTATMMVQRELADRIVAEPGSKTYGVPSVLCQQYADVELALAVGRGSFIPAPNVDSAVMHWRLREQPRYAAPESTLRRVVKAAFAQRRKTLRRALQSAFNKQTIATVLDRAGIDGQLRPEQLGLEQYAELACAFADGGTDRDS